MPVGLGQTGPTVNGKKSAMAFGGLGTSFGTRHTIHLIGQ